MLVAPPADEPPILTTAIHPTLGQQKPVAKVPPFDASPMAQMTSDKGSPTPVQAPVSSISAISYSEKTSVNAVSASAVQTVPIKSALAVPTVSADTVPAIKETAVAPPLPQPSPFTDDPNSYRMGGKDFYLHIGHSKNLFLVRTRFY